MLNHLKFRKTLFDPKPSENLILGHHDFVLQYFEYNSKKIPRKWY